MPFGEFGADSRVRDGSGTAITSIADGAGQVGLGVSLVATNFVASSANSSTAQLTASSTFTGTIETIFNQQTISILLTSDQPGTLLVNQYITSSSSTKVSAWSFSIVAGTAFSRAFTANGNYFNLSFQNTGSSTTTTLNINAAYGTLMPATNLGNQPEATVEWGGVAVTGWQLPPIVPTTSVTASATGSTNASNAVSLPAVSGKINYVTGFEVTAIPSTSIGTGVVTVVGTISGTLSYQFYVPTSSVAPELGKLLVEYTTPIPASASNTAITVTCPALGSGSGATAVVVHGFVQ